MAIFAEFRRSCFFLFLLDKMAAGMHNVTNKEDSDKSMPEQGKYSQFADIPACGGSGHPSKSKEPWQKSWY